MNTIEGNIIQFGIAQVDENYLYKQSLFIDKQFIKSSRLFPSQFKSEQTEFEQKVMENKYIQECMICHNNRKESIFFPCGHRCVCYNCAVLYFSVYHKCPKCNTDSKCIIKKVYD